MVMPALFDHHIHISAVARSSWFVILTKEEHSSKENIARAIRKYAAEHTKEQVPYMYVESCPTEIMNDPSMTKEFLDELVSDRPLLLCDSNYHRSLLNSRMLELLGVTDVETYEGKEIRSFSFGADGKPTGICVERAFEDIIDRMYDKIGWRPPSQATGDIMLPLLDYLNRCGVCYVVDGIMEGEDTLIGLQKLEKEGKLRYYYEGAGFVKTFDELEPTIENLRNWRKRYTSEHIHINTLKVFLDGTNEIGTSALLEPYCNDPDGKFCGELQYTEEQFTTIMDRANTEHMDIQVHLVGDRAFRVAMNAVEKAKGIAAEKGIAWTMRVTLLHCELTDPADQVRVAPLGVYINWTPHWSGGVFGESSKIYLGEERFNRMYAFNRMIETGAVVTYSSDVVDMEEYEQANPFLGMQIGHTRFDASLNTGRIREPASEKLSVRDLLRGYTINTAKAVGYENRFGSLEKGKSANLIVLNQNIFQVPEDQIAETRPVFFLFDGKVIVDDL